MIPGVQAAAGDKLPLASAEIDIGAINVLLPTMVVAIGKEQKQPLGAYARAGLQELRQQRGPQCRQILEDRVGVIECRAIRQTVHHLDRCTLRAGDPEKMIPWFTCFG